MGNGLKFMLGGALSGIGQGMALQQKMLDEERRDAALQAARMREIQTQSDLAGDRDRESDERTATSQANIERIRQAGETTRNADTIAGRAALGDASAKAQRDQTAAEAKFRINMQVLEHLQAKDKAAFENYLTVLQKQGQPDHYETDDKGNTTVIFANGATHSLGNIGRTAKQDAGESDVSALPRASAAKAPATPAATKQPETAPKIVTRAQLQEAAKAEGKSVQQLEDWARAQGWQIR